MAKPKEFFRSLLLGALIVYACLIPWGLFGAWNWTWGDPEHAVPADSLVFWTRVIRDTFFMAGVTFFKYWFATFSFAAFFARWTYRRRSPAIKA